MPEPGASSPRSASNIPMTIPEKLDLVAKLAEAAKASQKKWGVPASVTIAQAILESDWGQWWAAKMLNNFFAVALRPGNHYVAQVVPPRNKRGSNVTYHAPFRKFRSISACFQRHAELLATLSRYQPAMAVADDPLAFALQLQRCGSCTDPDYPTKLARLMAQFRLAQYDAPQKESR